jgi:UPF0755 protein
MKKFFVPIAIFFTLAVIGIGAFSWWSENSKAPSRNDNKVRFVIPKGRSATQTGDSLFGAGLIKSPLAFKVYVQVAGKAEKIQAGEFTLSPHLSLVEVVVRLTSGPEELWVTIPEGLRREEIVERFVSNLEMNEKRASVFREQFLSESKSQEGYLFPDTYLFPRDVSASVVVDKMGRTYDSETIQFHTALIDENAAGGLDNMGITILASIIERETKTEEERPVVAGILFNRIEIGMALQVDATVQYAVASESCNGVNPPAGGCDWWPVLAKQDLGIDSPYNSYKFTGLPPAPIANPGVSSIRAVIHPEDNDYLYYIHDSESNIYYAETLAEHNQNIRQHLGK